MKESHVPRTRGFSEGIDDEKVAISFNRMQKLPQFALIRRILINRIFNPHMSHFPSASCALLDFGCGTGHMLKQLRKMAFRRKIKMELHGIDISEKIIEHATNNLKTYNKTRTEVQLTSYSGEKTPYKDFSFNIIATSLSLHHWESPVQILNELKRIIKPNGYLLIFDFRRDAANGWHRFLEFITKYIVPKSLKQAKEPLGSLLASYTPEELKTIIDQSEWGSIPYEIKKKSAFLIFEAVNLSP